MAAIAAALLLLLGTASVARSAEPRVVIFSVDGMRPDVALRAEMPTLRRMMRNGCFTFWATTTPAAITLPSHTSMLTGVTIERHGIVGNDDDSAAGETIKVPTIFDLARASGLSTAMASGKSKFSMYAKPIDHVWQPEPRSATTRDASGETRKVLKGISVSDERVADQAIALLQTHRPRLMLVHFAQNDTIGHALGWGSPLQVEGLANTDKQIGRVVETLRAMNLLAETTLILSADHGGSGRTHGKDDNASKFIPWVIVGPGVRRNVDLSLYRDRPIRTYDTFATACRVMGLTPPADTDGSAVLQAFEGTELLNTGPSTEPAKVPATLPKESF
ncbi:MAG TPA: ectonucleotide pyrophosphatase/phosphodiesterase [Tepidisphaeraceae bacterium]